MSKKVFVYEWVTKSGTKCFAPDPKTAADAAKDAGRDRFYAIEVSPNLSTAEIAARCLNGFGWAKDRFEIWLPYRPEDYGLE